MNGMAPSAPHPRTRAMTVAIAVWCARRRWPVLAMWLVVTFGMLVASMAFGGTRSQSAMGSGDAKTESDQGYVAFQDAGKQDPGQQLWLVLGAREQGIADATKQAELKDIVERLRAAKVQIGEPAITEPIFESVTSALEAPPLAGLISADRTAAMVVARIGGETAAVESKVTALEPLLARFVIDYPDLRVMPLNNTLINREVGTLVSNDLDGSLKLTLPITFLILLIAFGTVIAGLVPIVLALTALVGAFGLMGLYSQAVEPVSQYASQVVVLIGLAVAVDYSLFLISRYRTERRAGCGVEEAIEVASSTAGRAVFFSGLAVAISLGGLLLMDNSIFRSIAVATICVVLISVAGSLTFLPATLSILGSRIEWLRLPYFGADRPEGTSVWARLVRVASGHPLVVAGAATIFLLVTASPVSRLTLGSTGIDGLPDTLQGVQAYQYMGQKWPQGTTLTLDTYVSNADRPETRTAISAYVGTLSGLPGIGQLSGMDASGDGTMTAIHYTLPGGRNDRANWDLVQTVRTVAVPAAFGALPDVKVWVSGDAASAKDQTELFARQTPMVMAFVLGLSFVLLLVVFHSIVIPLGAILLTLLSAGAAFGVLQLVFQEGWLKDLLDITPSPLESWLPAMIFTILFGLSMDYQVFILTRIKESRDRGLSSTDAVVKGVSVTAGTVTSAAAIMVAVFAVFVSLHFVMIRQMGLGLAVAVLVDATIVRSLLLPSVMKLLGDWCWYLPPFLRWIPRITIEGEPEGRLGDDAVMSVTPEARPGSALKQG